MALWRKEDRGKMNKWIALRDMIGGADVIVEVVDARDIPGTRLPVAERWAGSNRLVIMANKADLLPAGSILPKLPHRGVYVCAKNPDQRGRIIRTIMERAKSPQVKAILVGYPNVGKSTLINMLAKKKAAKVSAVAGTTKNIQWVRISDDLIISDYRGMFPEKEKAEDLVRKGAKNVQGDETYYAHIFIEKALAENVLGRWLEKRYDISLSGAKDSEEVLGRIAKRRGWIVKGGEPNLLEAARSVVRAMAEAPKI
ncbi:MAG TPA: GTPase [Candidatus Bilamarchaeum sp.]|nr:GTPase [Candidatus Bilamarchaeum sp.]